MFSYNTYLTFFFSYSWLHNMYTVLKYTRPWKWSSRQWQAENSNKKYIILMPICDMIKGNESDVADIVLWDIGKERVKIPLFYIIFSIDKFTNVNRSDSNGLCIKI